MKNTILSITKLSLLALFAISVSAEYKLGKDYRLVDSPMPVKKDGIVEVTESFWYGCAHCYSFEPAINNWKANLGQDTKLIKMPITWGGIHQLHAALYYTIEALKLDPSNSLFINSLILSYFFFFFNLLKTNFKLGLYLSNNKIFLK